MSAAQTRIVLILGILVTAVAAATALVFFTDPGDTSTRGAARAGATAVSTRIVTGTPGTAQASPPARQGTAPAGAPAATVPAAAGNRRGVTVQASGATNVRAGPGISFPVVAALLAGDDARATARNADGSWLLIELGAAAGWVAAGVVDVTGDPFSLPLGDAADTRSPTAAATGTARPSATASGRPPTAAAGAPAITATAGGLPDLVLQSAAVGAAGRLTLVIGNAGASAVTARRIGVVGLDDAGNVVFGEVTAALSIPSGGAVNVELTFRPTTQAPLTVVINADGAVEEVSAANNRLRVTAGPR